ncbi:hypothetical protein ElyMa_004802100 [Elysia marginata]|uniref:HAT C-terminal dimerisation domain-containing protein n=1 Tax=Elysia marginata TaxID=1093978 RepID=A0AAV4ILE6_9GAST|nr:hypothetical protein ElyMa_004802100 [Elysia marginata]
MDGPNVNWKVFRLLQSSIQNQLEIQGQELINIGSCGLHVFHNSFHAGHAASGWDLGHFFSSLSWLFKDTPAWREDFTELTGCTDSPLEHCPHRWIENVPVAERGLHIWEDVKAFVTNVRKEKKAPKTKSHECVEQAMDDPVIKVKIECFISLAKILQPLLVKYQTNTPMLPFLAVDLFRHMKSLLGRVQLAVARSTSPGQQPRSSCCTVQKGIKAPCEHQRVEEGDGDAFTNAFKLLLDHATDKKALFESFKATEGFDSFWHRVIGKEEQLSNLWGVMKKLLLLSHGQAQVERGFSLNKEAMSINLKEHSLVARRCIIDYVHAVGGLENVEITPNMVAAASCARMKYRKYLEEQQENKKKRNL